jgi:hypothetical protein
VPPDELDVTTAMSYSGIVDRSTPASCSASSAATSARCVQRSVSGITLRGTRSVASNSLTSPAMRTG